MACMSSIDGSLEVKDYVPSWSIVQPKHIGRETWATVAKIVQLQFKVQTKETQSTPEASQRLIFYSTGKQKNSYSKRLREVETFISIVAYFSASAQVHFPQQLHCGSTVELQYMLEVSLERNMEVLSV